MHELCRHILPVGRHCTQPAVNKTMYCRHHQVIKRTLDQIKPTAENYGIHTPLPFVFPEDRAALQLNFVMIAEALNDRRISVQTANAFNRIFRSCQINLQQGPLTEPHRQKSEPSPRRRNRNEKWLVTDGDSRPLQDQDDMVQAVILTPEGEEISIPREVLEEGEAEPVHGKECPCGVCDEEYRGAPIEQHHVKCKCGMCEEDLPSGHTRSAQETTHALTRSESELGGNGKDPNKIELSSRPERSEAEGPAVPQPSHQTNHPNESTLSENPSVLSVAPVVKKAVPQPSDQFSEITDQDGPQGLELRAEGSIVHKSAQRRRMRPADVVKRQESSHDITKFKPEGVRRYEEYREQVRKNQQAAREMWIKRYPSIPPDEPCLSWGEEHDKKLAAMREQSQPAASADLLAVNH